MSNKVFILILVLGAIFCLKRGFKEWDKEGYYSINIRLIGAGVTMLLIAIIMIVKEFD